MTTTRMEAFSDGVIAVIITIMVLELRAPESSELADLWPLLPVFLSYVISFAFVGIYWGNHHHMLHATTHINGAIMWANLHLLFWLSLTPFLTAWMGTHPGDPWPAALYGVNLIMAAIAYTILAQVIVRHKAMDAVVAADLGNSFKERASIGLYALGIVMAFVFTPVSYVLYAAVALMWLIPDRRIENGVK
jgi:uncharacterized membrane protein